MNWHIKRATGILRRGGVIAYPTEGVWGLGCAPENDAAVRRLLDLKDRDWRKGLILIAADFAQLLPYVEPLNAARMAAIHATWPGAVTWLLPARDSTPRWLRGAHATVAVRVTAHPVAARLCATFNGALVSTSANRAGSAPARTRLQVIRRFGSGLDYVVPGATSGQTRPTTIRDGASGAVLRPGWKAINHSVSSVLSVVNKKYSI